MNEVLASSLAAFVASAVTGAGFATGVWAVYKLATMKRRPVEKVERRGEFKVDAPCDDPNCCCKNKKGVQP